MKLDTICIQGGWKPKNGESRQLPIFQSTTWRYSTSEEMGKLFDLEASGYFYTRLQNPTNDVVADKIRELEGGVGAMLTSSGQAANFYAIFNIAGAGDHVLSTAAIYGGTSNLFTVTMKKMGIEVELIDQDLPEEEIAKHFRPNTKAVFGETLTNPAVRVLDLEKFARLAHSHGVPFIVDNTFPTPINCRPFEWGVDIVTHSTTKYMDGHACQTGGIIVDSGNFDWDAHADKFPGMTTPDDSYHGLTYTKKFGKMGYTVKLVAQLMRDLGSQASPFSSFLLNIGLETLHLRMPRHCSNALAVAKFLESRPEVEWVNYPGLESSRDHALAQKYMPNGTCGVIAFAVKGSREDAVKFIDRFKFISIETHVADSRTCVLHPASHTHRQLSSEQLKEAGIPEGLIRLSVGLEDAGDIIGDLEQAFAAK
ncbi:MAG: O-acetylhomoserine aminocarboxypropyltransferase/cysteine synthase [Kiritimatiellae bacterium]|jgi:O-acetylhomoserine (thiol)-lyase|nr:O-acetylhomoserine aminocarboxypropyltransferase/cysteine synthase [Kiritimatiellia bacterium]